MNCKVHRKTVSYRDRRNSNTIIITNKMEMNEKNNERRKRCGKVRKIKR